LDVLLDLTPDAADLVRQNPKLGVSARIIEDLERADGKTYPRALQHVLGTLDPRVTGMASWQEVALSTVVRDTIDITDKEVRRLPLRKRREESAPEDPAAETNTPEEDVEAETELARIAEELRTADLSSTVDVGTNSTDERIRNLELQLARERYTVEAREFIDKGVPPHLVTLAAPILQLPQPPVIELSNNEKIDVAQVLRDILKETEGFLELARERGSALRGQSQDDRAQELLDAWDKQ
jgi:hypothetical protein